MNRDIARDYQFHTGVNIRGVQAKQKPDRFETQRANASGNSIFFDQSCTALAALSIRQARRIERMRETLFLRSEG
jgi:hypothetical protein